MHCLILVICIITSLHVSDLSTAHNQNVEWVYVYVANGTGYISELIVSGNDWNGTPWSSIPVIPADSQLRSITSTICHIYTFYLLMMGR
jgi:hypothetical protein